VVVLKGNGTAAQLGAPTVSVPANTSKTFYS
jgi:hypothetical protein